MRIIALVLSFLFVSITYSQVRSDIEAVILEEGTDYPVSYATIRIKGTNQGVIADYDGTFRIPSEYRDTNTILLISSIGYKSKEISLVNLKEDTLNVIKLQVHVETLGEVVISTGGNREKVRTVDIVKASRSLTAYEIVQRAINNIPNNLKSDPHSYVSYYRDYQIVNNRYYNLNEAITESFDQGVLSNKLFDKKNQVALYSYELNKNFSIDSTFITPYDKSSKYIQNATIEAKGGNELTILNVHNPIRNFNESSFSFIYILERDFLNNHKVKRLKTTYLDSEPIVKIKIEGVPNVTGYNHRVIGEIYISLSDYSIHRFNYVTYDNDKRNPLFSINIEYKRVEENMFLNYITFNNRFVMSDEIILKEEDITFEPEKNVFIITFNREIDKETVSRRAFKLKYDKKKLFVESAKVRGKKTVEVKVLDFFDVGITDRRIEEEKFFVKISKIKDISGREIYKPKTVIGYQFRELFVQEVFPDKELSTDTFFVNQNLPLYTSKVNPIQDKSKYWVNSPLKQTKTN